MELEEMKRGWEEMNERVSRLETRLDMSKKTSAQDRLVRKYKYFAVFGVLAGVVFFPLIAIKLNIYVAIFYLAFMLFAGVLDYALILRLKGMDLAQLSVAGYALEARKCRRQHHIRELVLLPLAIALLVFFWYSTDARHLHIAIIIGVIIGLAAGIAVYLKMMQEYKQMME